MRQQGLLDGPDEIAPGIWLLPAYTSAAALLPDILAVAAQAPFRHMMTPGGHPTAAAMTNCGAVGWTADADGYRYRENDPQTGRAWPPIPPAWQVLARAAAAVAGCDDYAPDVCLVNRYAPGAGMGRHRDDSERDFRWPIVSVSLGLPAQFAWWGAQPAGAARSVLLQDGDVLVWGGTARLGWHAVRPLAAGVHPLCGAFRYNLTFRTAR